MHSNLTVLFLGLPRELDRFYRSIDELNKLNVVSKIMYSSWNGRLTVCWTGSLIPPPQRRSGPMSVRLASLKGKSC